MTRDISGCHYFRGTKMTQRGPQTLARFYGFESVEAVADSLPQDAAVLDAGAGASRFGHTIAAMRPDVRWTNLDVGYLDESVLAVLQKTAPENVTFVRGSITEAAELLPHSNQDRVFSFFALNYLGRFQIAGVRQLVRAAKPTGQVALGKLWIVRDQVATPSTIKFSPDPSNKSVVSHITQALNPLEGGAPPLPGVEYSAIRGDDSVK
ncbi:MAG TPA: class I SAM-dependent methyltransferase [Candidatus Saccharimonadales bacterium]|nr:class I SAM-dependent methyltransferase [Candidatus Saccharimonadales bacterium]